MDDARVGRALRALRTRRCMRQLDVARRAGISQGAISLIERGHVRTLSINTVRAAFAALDAGFEGHVTWRAGELDRVLDEVHAQLVTATVDLLQMSGWDVTPEATFSTYGERGSIDVLATWRRPPIALVVEAKTAVMSVEETLRRLDVKSRLAPSVIFERAGWRPATVARLLVVIDRSTQRRRVARFEQILRAAFPARNVAVRRWLRHPTGPMSGLMFLSPTNPGSTRARTSASRPAKRPESPSRRPVIRT